jgi:hypothetical protein
MPQQEWIERVLAAVEDGTLDRDTVIMACLKHMGDANIRNMCEANELFPTEADPGVAEYPDPIDDFNWVGSRHHY